eukprot:GHVU01032181.1.p1 GENE.GHVU01032181.1~~GHVU01032181.1.p1  ORF type:complete len:620 (+),score=129.04 GHVU01032181.1:282-2141(+)
MGGDGWGEEDGDGWNDKGHQDGQWDKPGGRGRGGGDRGRGRGGGRGRGRGDGGGRGRSDQNGFSGGAGGDDWDDSGGGNDFGADTDKGKAADNNKGGDGGWDGGWDAGGDEATTKKKGLSEYMGTGGAKNGAAAAWDGGSYPERFENETFFRTTLDPYAYTDPDAEDPYEYVEHPEVTGLSTEEVIELRKAQDIIVVQGENICPKPVATFETAGFPQCVMNYVSNPDNKLIKPSPIQMQCWPVIMSKYDLIGVAETGSGKTFAYAYPAAHYALRQDEPVDGEGPFVLIVVPAIELANQVLHVCTGMFEGDVEVTLCCGGPNRGRQATRLTKRTHIVVGTPGRLMDFIKSGELKLRKCGMLILDEADRLLDQGFWPQILSISGQIRRTRQTLMFTATWNVNSNKMANKLFCADKTKRPLIHIQIGKRTYKKKKNMTFQFSHVTTQGDDTDRFAEKYAHFEPWLRHHSKEDGNRFLIFVNMKRTNDHLVSQLRGAGYEAHGSHGSKSQGERSEIMRRFRAGDTQIVVASDLLARGIDLTDLSHVVVFDFPEEFPDLIHRIGRCCRMERSGNVLIYMSDDEAMTNAQYFAQILPHSKMPDFLKKHAPDDYAEAEPVKDEIDL